MKASDLLNTILTRRIFRDRNGNNLEPKVIHTASIGSTHNIYTHSITIISNNNILYSIRACSRTRNRAKQAAILNLIISLAQEGMDKINRQN